MQVRAWSTAQMPIATSDRLLSVLMELEGSVVEFVDSGALRLGYVRRREHRKVHVVDQRGRQSSVPTSRVIVIHETIPEEDFPSAATRIQERVEACRAEIDVGLLWESVHMNRREYALSELTDAYFGYISPEQKSAIYRTLSAETVYFKHTGAGFEPRSAEQVSAEKLRLRREQENERYRKEVTRLLRRAVEEHAAPEVMQGERTWAEVLNRLERWLRQNDRDDVAESLERIVGEARARQVAYEVLVDYGKIASTEDRFLLVRGTPTIFPREVLEASRLLTSKVDAAGRRMYTHCQTFAVDDKFTVEIDDALSAVRDGDETIIAIHIADVASFVSRDDVLDREAHKRSSTIYLPNLSVTMFPPRLATDLASLIKGATRPAFTVEARFSAEGVLVDSSFFRSVISVTDRLDYREADRKFAAGNAPLVAMHEIAQRLHDQRTEQGAQTHHRPDIKVHVSGNDIRVERYEADTPARLIVSEMMILANQLAASHAARSGIPIIFRTQEPPDDPKPDIAGLPEVIQFELLRRNFKRSRLSLYPAPHAGLGLSRYTQLSSPIRRYADLVTQRQFTAALEGEPLPYEREELLEIMTSCEAREIEIRRLEQTSTMWWLLTHLGRDHLDEPLEAVVVDKKGSVELTDFLVRAKLRSHDDLDPGDIVTVRIESVDPEHGGIHLHHG